MNKNNEPAVRRERNPYAWKRKIKRNFWAVIRGLLVFGLCFLIIQPLLSKLSLSFMTLTDLFDSTVINIPREPTTVNYRFVRELMSYDLAFRNSLWVTLLVAVLQVAAATVVGYGFARFRFPFQNFLFGLVLFTIIIPPQTIMTALYMNFRFFDIFGIITLIRGEPLNLLNTIIPYFILCLGCMGLKGGLYIYLMRQFFRGMPKELEEAAYVDGLGPFGTFVRIMAPGAKPMMTSCFLFSFVWQWTDGFYPVLFFRNFTLISVAVDSLADRFGHYWNVVLGHGVAPPSLVELIQATGVLMTMAPVLLMYLFAQRGFLESINHSGIKA